MASSLARRSSRPWCFGAAERADRLGRRLGEHFKEPPLGRAVVIEGLVVIQMLVRDVCDDGHIEFTAGRPLLRQAVRGHFEHTVGQAGGDHPRQVALDVRRIGRGDVEAGIHRLIADDGVYGGDQPRPQAGGLQDGIDQVSGGGLAIGAGDADEDHLARGETVPGCREPAERRARVSHAEQPYGLLASRPHPPGEVAFGGDGHSAPRQRLRHEAAAVHALARDGDEEGAWQHLARIGRDQRDFRIGSAPLKRGDGRRSDQG